jgi:hypothetical protein
MLRGERLELDDGGGVRPQLEVELEPLLERGQPQLRELMTPADRQEAAVPFMKR